MHGTLVRRALGGLVPPKIATPKLVVRFPLSPRRCPHAENAVSLADRARASLLS